MPRVDCPFEFLEKVNNNAYKIDFPSEYGILAIYNVVDLSPYLDELSSQFEGKFFPTKG